MNKESKTPVFYGIGHAIVDYFFTNIGEEFPAPLTTNTPTHLEPEEMSLIIEKLTKISSNIIKSNKYTDNHYSSKNNNSLIQRHSGGTTTNILKTASLLGAKCFFSATTGIKENSEIKDDNALFFQEEIANYKIEAQLASGNCETGRFLIAYNETGENAIAASPAAAKQIQMLQVNEVRLGHADCVIIEGMQCMNQAVLQRILELCLRYKKPLVIDVASRFAAPIVAKYLPELSNMIDIIMFANEDEHSALAINPEEYCNIYILKKGKNGAELWCNEHNIHIKAPAPITKVTDATGAGDTFAGAFLYSLFSTKQKYTFFSLDENSLKESILFASNEAAKKLDSYGI